MCSFRNSPINKPANGKRGFTLIEIMIALVLFSVLMGIIVNAIGLTSKLKDHGKGTSDKHLEPYITRVVIETDCRNFTEPLKGSTESKFDRTVLDESESITFYSVIQSPVSKRGISRVTYKASEGKLLRELNNINGDSGSSMSLSFLENLKSVSFAFSDTPCVDDATSEWPHRNRIPKYIVFNLVFVHDEDGHSVESDEEWLFSLGQVS